MVTIPHALLVFLINALCVDSNIRSTGIHCKQGVQKYKYWSSPSSGSANLTASAVLIQHSKSARAGPFHFGSMYRGFNFIRVNEIYCAAGSLKQSPVPRLTLCASGEPADLCPPCQGPEMILPKLSVTHDFWKTLSQSEHQPKPEHESRGTKASEQMMERKAKQAETLRDKASIRSEPREQKLNVCAMLQGLRSPGTAPCPAPSGARASLTRQHLPTHSGRKRGAFPKGTVPWTVSHEPSPASRVSWSTDGQPI